MGDQGQARNTVMPGNVSGSGPLPHYRLSPRVQMWKSILAKIRPEPPKASLAPEGVGAETRTFTATKTLRAAASKATTMLKGSYPTRQ